MVVVVELIAIHRLLDSHDGAHLVGVLPVDQPGQRTLDDGVEEVVGIRQELFQLGSGEFDGFHIS